MNRSNIVAVALIVVVLAVAGLYIYRATRPGTTIEFGSRTLTNDTWGAPSDEILTGGVYLNNDKTFGWYWDRTDPKNLPGRNFVQPIFPHVRIGSTFGVRTNSELFPLKVSNLKSLVLEVTYEYPSIPTGRYNLAYEMFLSDESQPVSKTVPKAEVMIWLHRTYQQPANAYQGDFTDGNNVYELYAWDFPDGRPYYSFIMKGQPQFQARHTVDAKRLLDSLALDGNLYILGVQFGNEVIDGSGKIQINGLQVTINGSKA